jgi:thiosulfate/3-mercaptopyruvate sulfurtransferase
MPTCPRRSAEVHGFFCHFAPDAIMRKLLVLGLISVGPVLAGFSAPPVSAQDAREALLVDASWLAEHLDEPGLVVLHVAAGEDALGGPLVPGSSEIHLDRISINQQDEGAPVVRLDLPDDLSSVRAAFEAAGISDDSRVVVTYADRRFPDATRTVWTLQVLGKDSGVSVLDGGIEAWSAAGGDVSTERSVPIPGHLTTAPRLDRRVDAAFVLHEGTADGVALIDARRSVSYDGTRPEMPGRSGHIPGAGSLPQTELYTDDGLLKSAAELRALFDQAGVTSGDGVVAYCHIGYWASAVVFAARTLGLDARLYDGSMTEWAANAELPLVVPEAGGGG